MSNNGSGPEKMGCLFAIITAILAVFGLKKGSDWINNKDKH